MIERINKGVLVASAAGLCPIVLAYLAYTRPWYFTSQTYIGGLIFLEFLVAAVWMYRSVYFPVVVVTFLLAGVNLPVGTGWTAARWVVLAVGALVGLLIVLRDRHHHFGLFHLVALFASLTALISAAVSRYPDVALLKVLSLFLLFLYAGTGGRLAAFGREDRYLGGLLMGCEIFVGANAVFYAVGIQAMGNPNSLGAVMGVFATPVLLWGSLLEAEDSVQRRRWVLYGICMYLTFHSQARAGLATALLSSGLLLLVLRRYRLLAMGSVVMVILAAGVSIFQPQALSTLTSSVVYKNKDEGILASRVSPWRAATENIRDHLWFGVGIGTTASGTEVSEEQGKFASSASVTAENGSSYLSIVSGVGLLGALPIALLLLLLLTKVVRTIFWMRRFGSPAHPAIPLAMIMITGMVHAGFEDWMLAPGNYLCVFFWSLAFVLVDVAPTPQVASVTSASRFERAQEVFRGVVPSP